MSTAPRRPAHFPAVRRRSPAAGEQLGGGQASCRSRRHPARSAGTGPWRSCGAARCVVVGDGGGGGVRRASNVPDALRVDDREGRPHDHRLDAKLAGRRRKWRCRSGSATRPRRADGTAAGIPEHGQASHRQFARAAYRGNPGSRATPSTAAFSATTGLPGRNSGRVVLDSPLPTGAMASPATAGRPSPVQPALTFRCCESSSSGVAPASLAACSAPVSTSRKKGLSEVADDQAVGRGRPRRSAWACGLARSPSSAATARIRQRGSSRPRAARRREAHQATVRRPAGLLHGFRRLLRSTLLTRHREALSRVGTPAYPQTSGGTSLSAHPDHLARRRPEARRGSQADHTQWTPAHGSPSPFALTPRRSDFSAKNGPLRLRLGGCGFGREI